MTTCCVEAKTIYQGDTLRLRFIFTKGDGSALDLTGATVVWELYAQRGQPALLTYTTGVNSELVITDAAGGLVDLTVPGSETSTWSPGGYLYQVKSSLPGPPPTDKTNISGAQIIVKAML